MKYILCSFICCLLDLFSKRYINNSIEEGSKREVLPEKLYFFNTKNAGIAYNRLENKPKTVKCITSIITSAFGIYFLKLMGEKNAPEYIKIGSAIAFGGALGNLIDRLKNNCVTDFIYVKSIKKSPVFNLADLFITVGALIMAFGDIFKH